MQRKLNFDISAYLTKGYEFYKAHWEKVFVGFLCVLVMSIIPFCQLLGMGNYFKFLRRLEAGENPSYEEIFSFNNAWPYIKSYLFMFLAVLILEIPLVIVGIMNAGGEPTHGQELFMLPYMFIIVGIVFYLSVRLYYYVGILALQGEQDLKKAWNKSFALTKGNFLSILAFLIIISFLSQLGFLACCIGLVFTMPFHYTSTYFSYKAALLSAENSDVSSDKINYY